MSQRLERDLFGVPPLVGGVRRTCVRLPPEGGTPNGIPSAFTLMELLTVMVIIAILAAVTTPAIRAIGKDSDRVQAVNQVRAAVNQARAIALAQHRQAGVVFFEETTEFASPVHGAQTAMQIFVEDYDQTRLVHSPNNTIFIPFTESRSYLPAGLAVAALNDDLSRGVMTGDESSKTLGKTRAVLFNAEGHMIMRHGLARQDEISGSPAGSYPNAEADWNFATQGTGKTDTSSHGVSSPGVFLFDDNEYLNANIPNDDSGNAARNAWVKQHASVVLVNANTGGVIQ